MTLKMIFFLTGPILAGITSIMGFFLGWLPMPLVFICMFISFLGTIGYSRMVIKDLNNEQQ